MRKLALACACLALMVSSADARHHKWAAPVAKMPTPVTKVEGTHFKGIASYYSYAFSGRKTACGVEFRPAGLTAASRNIGCFKIAEVVNLKTHKSVRVTITDYGPAVGTGRIIDLSEGAATIIGMRGSGTALVDIQVLD